MASVKNSAPDEIADTSKRLYRVSYVDTIVRETFVYANDENEAEDIVEREFADAKHHHAIDAYHDDVQSELLTAVGRRPLCFECGHAGGSDIPAAS